MGYEKVRGNKFFAVCFLVPLNYMTQPSTTQVLALPATSEQYALFLTPIRWTNQQPRGQSSSDLTNLKILRERICFTFVMFMVHSRKNVE